jgi:predicted nuclease of predicted toxin-antitoxin system
MRFLANENVTGTVIEELRQHGPDALSVKESMRSERDDVILARAQAEERTVVTHDKDFGELAFRSRLPASCGVILLQGNQPYGFWQHRTSRFRHSKNPSPARNYARGSWPNRHGDNTLRAP